MSNNAATEALAQFPTEPEETEANPKRKDPGNHLVFPGSSADFVTVRKSLDAPERSRTNAVFPEVQPLPENGGHTGGHIEPNSDRYARFQQLLLDAEFTPTQLILISDALREAGLQLVSAQELKP